MLSTVWTTITVTDTNQTKPSLSTPFSNTIRDDLKQKVRWSGVIRKGQKVPYI